MPVKVILSSTLRKYVPEYDSLKGLNISVAKGSSLRELIRALGIPEKSVKIAMVNGIKANMDTRLRGDERIGLFPAVGGG